uniref:Uncharacterized protein n=1 Tax=Globisporangium ultimum (strain ATCC 200006 / CBS 805.95 / DAOM BR144) TaxID=431595 RepID=K3WAS2_GLOUD
MSNLWLRTRNGSGSNHLCEWSVEALNGWYHLISSLQEPCLRQSALQFCFQLLRNTLGKDTTTSLKVHQDGDSADKMEHRNCTVVTDQVCTQIMLLGVTDVWSAIRKECAQKAVSLVFMLPAMEAIDTFIERLLHVAVGSEYVRTQDTTRLTQWRERDGALYTLSLILKSIEIDESSRNLGRTNDLSAILATRVASDIKGFCGPESTTTFQFGARHTNVARLPRSLAQTLKPVLYQCLRHDQLSVRENAAQCLKQYVGLCEEPMRLAIFQEVISKLNRMKESHDDNSSAEQELLETYEAEGLLAVLGKLVPSLPSQFLLKHWKFIFPTLEKYVMHISSNVRQKSSAVVLSLAKLTRKRSCDGKDRSSDAAVELLLEMLLSLSEQPHDSNNFCWQQKEGRLLSIDLLVDFLGKDLLLGKYGTKLLNSVTQQHELRKESRNFDEQEDQWANACSSLATWTVGDDDMLDLSASSGGDVHESGQPQSAPSLVDLINEFAEKKTKNTGKYVASEFWQRVLTGWLCQTRQAFTSNQFELRRISRQILPGLSSSDWTRQISSSTFYFIFTFDKRHWEHCLQ